MTTTYTDELDPRGPTWARPADGSVLTFREQRIVYWRTLAREHLAQKEAALARRAEEFAIFWEGWP